MSIGLFITKQRYYQAFQDNSVAEADLNGATGYGDDDIGRDKLDRVYAQVFDAEDAISASSICFGYAYFVYSIKWQFKIW